MSTGGNGTGRILVIGMEMGDGHLIRRWCADDKLPVLQNLLDNGKWAWLETTAQVLHVSAWPSLYTGTDPARHGHREPPSLTRSTPQRRMKRVCVDTTHAASAAAWR